MAILFAFRGEFIYAFWMIVASAVFDFFDGFAARMLKAYSKIGADLDSLADVVSFGVAPAVTMMMFINLKSEGISPEFAGYSAVSFLGLLLAPFSALRLAKFNVDTRQSESFIGLPTPAMALFISSYVISVDKYVEIDSIVATVLNISVVVVFCWLMVSEIAMFSFKFKRFSFTENKVRYLFAIFAVLAVITLGYSAPAVIIAGYVLVSLITQKSAN